MTRVMFIADLHCGHMSGLTPPEWDSKPGAGWPAKKISFYDHRREIWDIYEETIFRVKPDVVIVPGDAIDGKGQKSGGTEQLTADRNEQCWMAVAALKRVNAKRYVMSYGTSYHVGFQEDWEDQVAKGLSEASIGGEDNAMVHGKVINYRHYLGGSSVPHGRATPLNKEVVWNKLWSLRGEYPAADVIARAHNHYYVAVDTADTLAFSLPAACGYGSKFGTRICSGTVDFGFVWMDIEKGRDIAWDKRIHRFVSPHEYALIVE